MQLSGDHAENLLGLGELVEGLAELWNETTGDERVCVAILDGPVDLSHQAFRSAKLQHLETLAGGIADEGLATRHGTHIASIIFGCHDGPVKGISPRCRGLIVPVFRDVDGKSPVPCAQIDLARAINQAVMAGADIINISGGEFSPTGTAHPILTDAIRNCDRSGVLIVAAAGNQGCDCLHIPAALPAVLPVGAMDASGQPLDFSNWGVEYRTRGVLALGDRIVGAVPSGGVRAESGTSYATPVVSGVVALLMSLHFVRYGTRLDCRQVRDAILETAIDCDKQPTADCLRLLGGRLNITGAKTIFFLGVQPMNDDQPNPELTPSEAATPAPTARIVPAIASTNFRSPSPFRAQEIKPSGPGGGCGCGGGENQAPQLVYSLGQLGVDFGTEARRDSFVQSMDPIRDSSGKTVAPGNPHDPLQLLAYLTKNPWDGASLTWTLNVDVTPVYAILPAGPFAAEVHARLREFLADMIDGVERVSIPGIVAGSVRLMNGQIVPAIIPEMRGMFSWTTQALIQGLMPVQSESASDAEKSSFSAKAIEVASGVRNFLDRVYFELRNLGQTPQERAINYAATNAFNIELVYEQAVTEKMDLDTIEVERSPLCRSDSDCWDVKLMFFFPEQQPLTARRVYRFTIDVSDVVPVTVGEMRTWKIR